VRILKVQNLNEEPIRSTSRDPNNPSNLEPGDLGRIRHTMSLPRGSELLIPPTFQRLALILKIRDGVKESGAV